MATQGKTRSWDAFNAWCDERGLNAAPANPWTLAAYIRYLEGSMRFDALRRHVDHIGQMHHEKRRTRPDRDTMVQRLLDGVRRREDAQKRAREKPPAPPPLFEAEDFLDTAKPKASKPRTKPKKPAKSAKRGALRATPKLVRRKRV